jgi:hypothetical protein
MLDYYLYLWQVTWFEAFGFLALCLFIIVNLVWKTLDFHRQGWESFARLRFAFRILVWVGVLTIYLGARVALQHCPILQDWKEP